MGNYSDRVVNAMLDAVETIIGASPTLEFRSGLVPATAAAADSGTLIASAALPADFMTAAAARSKAKVGTWQDTAADAAGYIGHFRIKGGGACDIQGLCSQPYTALTAVVVGQHMHNGGNVYRATTAGTTGAASAPTGTGTGIADGTAVWAYAGPVSMTLDNTNVTVGQPVVVNTYTWTGPAA